MHLFPGIHISASFQLHPFTLITHSITALKERYMGWHQLARLLESHDLPKQGAKLDCREQTVETRLTGPALHLTSDLMAYTSQSWLAIGHS